MITRVWRRRCISENSEGFKEFLLTKLLPRMRGQQGCLFASVATDRSSDTTEMIIISEWWDPWALTSFIGQDWSWPTIIPEAASYLADQPKVEHFEVVGKYRKHVPGQAREI